tara:strand:- start:305 stop:724 length:420 start_codon:yes stop_codon:yes gene_type:complete
MIKIQQKDFNIDEEINNIKSEHDSIGAMTSFVGYVRNTNNNKNVESINIDVYEEMALKSLEGIFLKTKEKWSIIDALIIHRFGNLKVNEKIVLVATFSKHRKDSNESCSYIMDFLKKDAPFWKKEYYSENDFEWLKNSK